MHGLININKAIIHLHSAYHFLQASPLRYIDSVTDSIIENSAARKKNQHHKHICHL